MLSRSRLPSATEALRRSALVRRWYGDALVEHYALSRDAEHAEWRRAASVLGGDPHAADEVPEWELARYFELV